MPTLPFMLDMWLLALIKHLRRSFMQAVWPSSGLQLRMRETDGSVDKGLSYTCKWSARTRHAHIKQLLMLHSNTCQWSCKHFLLWTPLVLWPKDCQTVKVRTFPICIFSKLRCLQVCCELDIVQKPVLMSINASSIHGAKLRSRRWSHVTDASMLGCVDVITVGCQGQLLEKTLAAKASKGLWFCCISASLALLFASFTFETYCWLQPSQVRQSR